MFVRAFSLTAAHVRQRGHSEAGPRELERRGHLLRLLHAQDRVRQGKHQPTSLVLCPVDVWGVKSSG